MTDSEHALLVVSKARSWLGTPYLHQAASKGLGCDCLGLVRGVWRELFGKEPEAVPSYSSVWTEVDRDERLLCAAQRNFAEVPVRDQAPGHVLIFRMRRNSAAKHAGILSSKTHFIHAYEGNAVVESALSQFWASRIAGVFRYPKIEGSV